CLCPEYTLLSAIFRHMRLLPDEVVLLDTPAGMEHFGRAVADGFTCGVVVADPSYNALSVAKESSKLAEQLGIREVILAVNRVGNQTDAEKLREKTGGFPGFSRLIFLPFDSGVVSEEPVVISHLAGGSTFIRSVRTLAAMITSGVQFGPQNFE
ncbi:MAG TPA: cobyrinic acid a,c-diamide synthase, partial [Methanoregula sp.]|nr:cobyrinic acid a,c-diamide synthase [Methanoregula sp.]